MSSPGTESTRAGKPGTGTSPYRKIGLLAQGGMGRIELCVRVEGTFQRVFAVKRLKAEHLDDPSYRTMFLDEARIAGLLRHPNVVSVLDVGTDDHGPYLAMDFIPSINASHLLKWAAKNQRLLPVQLAVRIVRQATAGLRAAHDLVAHDGTPLRLIHRDVSPQNILLGFDGLVRVADFGIAKAHGRASHTTTGILKGKAGYMSPEQLRFERPSQRSDLFSLGVVLYELLSARRLYQGKDSVEVAQRILSEPVPDIFEVRDDVPEPIVELLFELLAKNPEHRPESAGALLDRFDAVLQTIQESEEPLTLEKFLGTHFADRRTREQERLAELLRREAPVGPEPIASRGIAISSIPTRAEPRNATNPASQRATRAFFAWAAVGLLVMAIASAAAFVAPRTMSDSSDHAVTRSASAPVVEPTSATAEPIPASPGESGRRTEAAAAAGDPDALASPPESTGSVPAASTDTRDRVRRRTTRARRIRRQKRPLRPAAMRNQARSRESIVAVDHLVEF